jgi:hypothetical protein
VREVYITLLTELKLVDYFDQTSVILTTAAEKKTLLIPDVSPGAYTRVIDYMMGAGFYTDVPKVLDPRGIFLKYTAKHASLLVQGPPRFTELVKVSLDGLKGDMPQRLNYGFRRVHCRHALVNQRTFAAATYGTELVVPGVFEILRGVLGDSKPGSLVYNPSVVFADSPAAIITGGPDGSGLQNAFPQLTTREIISQTVTGNSGSPFVRDFQPSAGLVEQRALERVESVVQEAITRETFIPAGAGSAAEMRSARSLAPSEANAQGVTEAPKDMKAGSRSGTASAASAIPSPPGSSGPPAGAMGVPGGGRRSDDLLKLKVAPTQNRLYLVNELAKDSDRILEEQPLSGNEPSSPLLPLPERLSLQQDAPVALGPTPGGHYGKLGETFDVLGASAGTSQTVITADTRTNSIFIFGPTDMLDFYEEMVKALDFPQLLVEISAAVVDVNAESTFEWNSRLAGVVKGEIQDKDGVLGAGFDSKGPNLFNNLVSAAGPTLTGPLVDNAGLNVAGMLVGESYKILGQFRALERIGQARIVSRPSVMTLDNVLAALTDSTRFYVPVQGKEDARLYEIKAETKIKVHPHLVFPDEDIKRTSLMDPDHRPTRVRLLIDIEDGVPSTTLSTTTQVLGPDGTSVAQTIPSVINSRINTQGEVEDGQSLLIGGRYRNEQTNSDGHVPIIGKIPVLGLAFKGKTVVQRRIQRLFIITPRIVDPSRQTRLAKEQMEAVMESWSTPPPNPRHRPVELEAPDVPPPALPPPAAKARTSIGNGKGQFLQRRGS